MSSTACIRVFIHVDLLSYMFCIDWYDNEHGPARLSVPGLTNAARYKASDSLTPGWLTMADLVRPEVASSESYKALATQVSAREKELIPRLKTLNRRIYELLSEKNNPSLVSSMPLPASSVLAITAQVQSTFEEDFDKWNDEHIHDLLKLSGFLRARRFKIVDSVDLTRKSDLSVPKVHNSLILYDWDGDDESVASMAAASLLTQGSLEIFGKTNGIQVRRFVIHKIASKPDIEVETSNTTTGYTV